MCLKDRNTDMDLTKIFDDDNNSGKRYQQSLFKKRGSICIMCGRKTGWNCDVTEDEGLAFCKYTPSDKKDSQHRYQHILKKGHQPMISSVSAEQVKSTEIQKADADRLNKVYSAMLNGLSLSAEHREGLKNRGLRDETINGNLYRSVPSREQKFEIAKRLTETFDLEGVPGFYLENGRWVLNITMSGFYVPYTDAKGRISGMQIRQDRDAENKYLWLSSAKKEKGCSSGVPLHFFKSKFVEETNIAYLTEGALKADIISELFFNVGGVAISGINSHQPQKLIEKLLAEFPNLSQINLAFDMDWNEKVEVRNWLLKLLDALQEKTLKVFVVTWDREKGKGLDDACLCVSQTHGNLSELSKNLSVEEYRKMLLECESGNSDLKIATEIENPENPPSEQDDENQEDETATYTELTESDLSDVDVKEEFQGEVDTFGMTWGDFSKTEFPTPERVMFGLYRGNIGLLNASTNVGKSTLILNMALSAASNRKFEPLINDETVGKRILYIDGESTQAELKADIMKMSEKLSDEERRLLNTNLRLICDEDINDEPLDLVNPDHKNKVLKIATQFQADLIIVDTLSALTVMEDENDNAKVKKEIIQPLKNLAKKANAGVLILHHTGKGNEGGRHNGVDAYKGRGASAFGALARTAFYLQKAKGNTVELSCPKSKGKEFEAMVFELDRTSRWFKNIGIAVTPKVKKSKYDEVVEIVHDLYGKEVKRSKIVEILTERGINIPDPTLTRFLNDAVEKSDLLNPRHGYYSAPVNPDTELQLEE